MSSQGIRKKSVGSGEIAGHQKKNQVQMNEKK
jgi:hypothetical protein